MKKEKVKKVSAFKQEFEWKKSIATVTRGIDLSKKNVHYLSTDMEYKSGMIEISFTLFYPTEKLRDLVYYDYENRIWESFFKCLSEKTR